MTLNSNPIKVNALFLDFDGTLSPINIPLSEASVPPETLAILREIQQHIPIAIVTSKSLPFVIEKTPFAQAWSALGGLETKIGDVVTKASCLANSTAHVAEALKYARTLCDDLAIEEKSDSEGTIVAFSVDWRSSKNPAKAKATAQGIAAYCETLSVFTVRYENHPFFDVFPCKVDKGDALLLLKEKLGLREGILYMGDSALDSPAFELADVAVCVVHAETPLSLPCDCFVKFENVARFLEGLQRNDFKFSSELPFINK